MADDLPRMRRTIDDRTRLCQAGVAVTASSGENVKRGYAGPRVVEGEKENLPLVLP